jgi:hypothetical protein
MSINLRDRQLWKKALSKGDWKDTPENLRLREIYAKRTAEWRKKPGTKVAKKSVPMRPIWHFHADYGNGTLSPEYCEYLLKHGRTIHNPILWLRNRKPKLKLKKRRKLKFKRR